MPSPSATDTTSDAVEGKAAFKTLRPADSTLDAAISNPCELDETVTGSLLERTKRMKIKKKKRPTVLIWGMVFLQSVIVVPLLLLFLLLLGEDGHVGRVVASWEKGPRRRRLLLLLLLLTTVGI